MALTNAEKQAAWRARQAAKKDRLILLEALIENGALIRSREAPPDPLTYKLVKVFGDGEWHRLDAMAGSLRDSEKAVAAAVEAAAKAKALRFDTKRVGIDRDRGLPATKVYRIFPIAENAIGALEIAAKLAPILEGLEAEGRKNMATMSPAAVASLAGQLKNLLNEWMAVT